MNLFKYKRVLDLPHLKGGAMHINYNNNPKKTRSHFWYGSFKRRILTENCLNKVKSHLCTATSTVWWPWVPKQTVLKLEDFNDNKAFGTDYFLQRRELGIVNLGEKAEFVPKRCVYVLEHLDAVYLGKGEQDIEFRALEGDFAKTLLFKRSCSSHISITHYFA